MTDSRRGDYRSRVFASYLDTLSEELRAPAALDLERDCYPVFAARHLPLLPADKDARIVDIGCGLGHLLAFLRDRGYRDLLGVDVCPQMVARALQLGVRAQEAEALSFLRAHPNEFDCILACDVLEHLLKDELCAWMDAAHRALKPGGCFVAKTVNADGFGWGRMRHMDITHETAFTSHSLGQLFRLAGFGACSFHPMEPVGAGLRGLLRTGAWRLLRLAGGLYYHVEHGSGILRNDHVLTPTLLAKAVKKPG